MIASIERVYEGGLTHPLSPLQPCQALLHKGMEVLAEARHERLGIHLHQGLNKVLMVNTVVPPTSRCPWDPGISLTCWHSLGGCSLLGPKLCEKMLFLSSLNPLTRWIKLYECSLVGYSLVGGTTVAG